jgi:thiol:disulfide interchange protein
MGHPHCRTIAAITVLMIAAGCRPEPSPSIPWQPSFPLALETARKEGKPVFLYISAAWCTICRRVERDSFGDPEVVSSLGSFVPVTVDIDQYPWVGRQYNIAAVPAFLVLDGRGQIRSFAFGFQGPDAITTMLSSAASEATPGE